MTGAGTVMRHRYGDRDLAVSRAIVYGALAVMIVGVYVAVVGGLGQLVGGDEPSTALAITATGVVALTFQPLRLRLQRRVDRIVHGKTATPHEVLSEFSRRVAANDDALLALAAKSLVAGTAATRVGVWMRINGRLIETTAWPAADGTDGEDMTSLPVGHGGVELGVLTVSVPGGQGFSEQDQLLARRVASAVGLALGNRARTAILQSRVEELRLSRRRLVAVLDDTRRRLERDLHDGAQQQLVALKVKLALARSISERDGAMATAGALRGLTDSADITVDAMRQFARGLYPPLLEAEGLGPAITALARQVQFPVAVEIDGVGRYDRQIETTINVCIVEALENVARHAHASVTHVSIAQSNGSVTFSVRDDGVGFDVASVARRASITHMADRVEAVEGTLSVRSTPGGGTIVSGTIPVAEGAPS